MSKKKKKKKGQPSWRTLAFEKSQPKADQPQVEKAPTLRPQESEIEVPTSVGKEDEVKAEIKKSPQRLEYLKIGLTFGGLLAVLTIIIIIDRTSTLLNGWVDHISQWLGF